MARLLLVYHYGGIYMDTDFYCYKPFNCLINKISSIIYTHPSFKPYTPMGKSNSSHLDILVISLEPKVHANLFRNKERVLIQDFFLTTPKHPFFKWLLDTRNNDFNQPGYSYLKGPFSYAIEKDVDLYRQIMMKSNDSIVSPFNTNQSMIYKSDSNTDLSFIRSIYENIEVPDDLSMFSKESFVFTKTTGLILELREDILHPLIDSTNSRLYSVCENEGKKDTKKDSCEIVSLIRCYAISP